MGHYSNFKIGDFSASWKYTIPAFATFLFSACDAVIETDDQKDTVRSYYFKTSISKARSRMEQIGYTNTFFDNLYGFFREEVIDLYESELWEASANRDWGEEKIEDITEKASKENFEFTKFIEEIERSSQIDLQTLEDPEVLLHNVENKSKLNPNLAQGLGFLQTLYDFYYNTYSEILDLVIARVMLELQDPDKNVQLNIGDLYSVDPNSFPTEGIEVLTELKEELIKKTKVYDKSFQTLLDNDAELNRLHLENKLLTDWKKVKSEEDSHKKGDLLEDFTVTLFKLVDDFSLHKKNKDNGDQELDLIYDNKNEDLLPEKSEQVLIECKNWTNKVGTPQLQAFFTKMEDHTETKIGFFISVGGFTEKADTDFLKRIGRVERDVVLIDKNDIQEFIDDPSMDPGPWLREKFHESTTE